MHGDLDISNSTRPGQKDMLPSKLDDKSRAPLQSITPAQVATQIFNPETV
jgi:hypothetical protein